MGESSDPIVSDSELVAAYLRRIGQPPHVDFWAFEEVNGAVWSDPERGWALVTELVARASESELKNVAAGPLEALVNHHPVAVIDRVEALAGKDPKFRACLSAIWLSEGELPSGVESRIVAATGGQVLLLHDHRKDVLNALAGADLSFAEAVEVVRRGETEASQTNKIRDLEDFTRKLLGLMLSEDCIALFASDGSQLPHDSWVDMALNKPPHAQWTVPEGLRIHLTSAGRAEITSHA